MSVKKSSASKCYITEDYFLSYFIFVYNMLKWTCWTRAYIALLSQIKIPDTSGVDFNFVCYGRHPKTIEYGFIKIFVYLIRGAYWKRTLIKSIFYTSEIVWSTIP